MNQDVSVQCIPLLLNLDTVSVSYNDSQYVLVLSMQYRDRKQDFLDRPCELRSQYLMRRRS